MTWVAVREDKQALYNLDHFEAISVFESPGSPGWNVVGIQGGRPNVSLAKAPSQEAAENILRAISEEIGAMDLGQE